MSLPPMLITFLVLKKINVNIVVVVVGTFMDPKGAQMIRSKFDATPRFEKKKKKILWLD